MIREQPPRPMCKECGVNPAKPKDKSTLGFQLWGTKCVDCSLKGLKFPKAYNKFLSDKEYHQVKASQNSSCNICNTPFVQSKQHKHSACVDHDHATGKVRSMLCRSCNLMLGYAQDQPDILIRAAEYLKDYRANN